MQFEAYHKKIMYGTDVISVINKAAENNRLCGLTNGQDENVGGYVNIVLDVNGKTYKTEVYRYNKTLSNSNRDNITEDFYNGDSPRDDSTSRLNNLLGTSYTSYLFETIRPGYNNNLGNWEYNGVLRENESFVQFFSGTAEDESYLNVYNRDDGVTYDYYIYKALTVFKKDTFTCSNVIYDQTTGRIRELTFTRVEKTN